MGTWGDYFSDPENVKRLLMWIGGLYVTAYIVYSGMPEALRVDLGFSPTVAAWFAFTALIAQGISNGAARRLDPPK